MEMAFKEVGVGTHTIAFKDSRWLLSVLLEQHWDTPFNRILFETMLWTQLE